MAGLIKEENEADLQAQIEEVEALSSIYGDEWCVIDEASRIFCIKISSDLEEPKLTACLQIILPSDYPSAAPPIYQINAAWLRGPERVKLANSLEDIYVEHPGESILYLWVERVREFLVEKSQCSGAEHPGKDSTSAEEGVDDDDDEEYLSDFMGLKLNTENAHLFMDQGHDEELPLIKHGNPVTDRRSTFQPHLALVVSPRQVKMVLEKLYMNKKIASATHNIYAYRIYCEDKNSFLQDCEDDGETAAGGRLLHLLQVKYRAQRNMTRQAVLKMVAVWVLAFFLYGPAIIFWEAIVGQSIVPAHECYAEFYFTWYFLLSASTFEFFTPFVSVAFFNLSIYLNIHQRNKNWNACAEDEPEPQRKSKRRKDGGGWSVFFVKTRKVTSSEPAAISAVIEDEDVLSPSSSGCPDTSQIFVQREKFSPHRKNSRLFQQTASCMPPGRRTPGSRLSRDKKIAKSLAIIVCIFGICWAPYTLLMIIRAACSGECVANYWYEMTFWLLWLNSAINPFLYPLCHTSFRRAFSKILCPKRQSVQPQIEAQSC